MQLKDILISNHWLSIAHTLIQHYPEEEENLFAYKEVYEQLREMQAGSTDMLICIKEVCEEGEESYFDVYGVNGEDDENGESVCFALEFVDWELWLGMHIDEECLADLNELEIAAHCLYEMTYVSFDEEEIKRELKELLDSIEDLKELPDLKDDQQLKQMTFDEFMRKFGDESGHD